MAIAAVAAAILGLTLLLPAFIAVRAVSARCICTGRAAAAVFVLQLPVVAPANAVLHTIVNLWRDQLAQRQALLGPSR